MEPKPRQLLAGTIWGLWIAGYAKYSPDLWGQPCQVSASFRVTRLGFSPPEGCMQRKCIRRQRRSWLAADQLLGNSVGAIESVVHDTIAFSLDRVSTWVASASPCLVKLASFGGSAFELRLFGLR